MDYKKVNDYEVMYMIRENDDEARGLLLKKYSSIINKYASKYLGYAKFHGVEFEDLVQEGYIALDQAINGYNENSGTLFFTYANLCINRHMLTYCRNLSSKKNYILDNSIGDDCFGEIVDSYSNPEDIFSEKLLEESFSDFKNLFDIRYSSIIELRYNGFTYKEISKLLDIPLSTVDGRLYRIKKVSNFKDKLFC